MTTLDELLDLQRVDTELDQLRYRRDHLPEQQLMRAARDALLAWERRRQEIREELDELARKIRAEEAASADLDTQRDRLQAQLKTVVAPREAEALMHEIDELTARRSQLDDDELANLEATERLDAELAELVIQEEPLRATAVEGDEVLAERLADIDREIEAATARRLAMRDAFEDGLLKRYDTLRERAGGVAVAQLNGRQCDACHMELSPAEADQLKDVPEGEIPECPQCGRMLVR